MVKVTDRAAEEIEKVLKAEKKEDHGIKLFIAGVGCQGPSYGMSLAKEPEESEETLHANGVKVFLSEEVSASLEGCEIDFLETEYGSGFTILNPNEQPSCGTSCSSC